MTLTATLLGALDSGRYLPKLADNDVGAAAFETFDDGRRSGLSTEVKTTPAGGP